MNLRQIAQRLARLGGGRDPILEIAHRCAETGDLDGHLPADEAERQLVLRCLRDSLHCGYRRGGTRCDFRRAQGIPEFDGVELDNPVLVALLVQVESRIKPNVFD